MEKENYYQLLGLSEDHEGESHPVSGGVQLILNTQTNQILILWDQVNIITSFPSSGRTVPEDPTKVYLLYFSS